VNQPYDPNQTSDLPSTPADTLGIEKSPADPGESFRTISRTARATDLHIPDGDLPVVPGYRVLGEIARGGMGRVLAASDLTLHREVALKLLLPGANPDRFVREAKITARLPHPGIPPVYALGTLADGSPFLAMKLVAGQTLAAGLATTDRSRLLQAVTQVCHAVGFAHSQGVTHRDLKPANVMVGAFGEVQVMDWGLAFERDEGRRPRDEGCPEPSALPPSSLGPHHSTLTQAGAVMGTPAYMAPEQARGEPTDARADVFALGGILCAVLTGEPPFCGRTTGEVVMRAAAGDLTAAFGRLAGCGADPELVALCRRCLAPDRADRPADGQAVADGLTAHLDGVQERLRAAERGRAVAVAQAAEQRKRRRVQAALGLAVVALVALGGAGAWWEDRQAVERAAVAERVEADRAREQATVEADRRGRVTRSEGSVAVALTEARGRFEEAWVLADDPGQMWSSATFGFAALHRADGYVAVGDVPAAILADVAAVRAAAAELDRHATLFLAADRILQNHANLSGGKWDNGRTAGELAAAVRAYGWAAGKQLPDEVAGAIAASRVRNQLLGYLGEWDRQGGNEWVRAVLRLARHRAGGTLAEWQALRDAKNSPGLVSFAAGPRAMELGPEQLCQLGQDLSTAGANPARLDLLRRGVVRYPGNVWLRFDLVRTCESQTPPLSVEALQHAAAAAALRPTSPAFQNDLSRRLNLSGAATAAVATGREAVRLAPTFADAHNNLGGALLNSGNPAGAEACWREAVRLEPSNTTHHNNLGVALRQKGDLAGAIESFRDAIRLDPTNALAHSNLADAVLHLPPREVAPLPREVKRN